MLRVDAPTYDFGRMREGGIVRHDFRITNSGTAPLQLFDVNPSCSCTSTGNWPATLAPGASAVIPVRVDTAGFSEPITKTVIISSNDPTRPDCTLEVTGVVWAPVAISPAVLVFPALTDPERQIRRTVDIENHDRPPLRLSALSSDNPRFVPILREVKPGRSFAVTVATVPPLPTGTHIALITMKSSDPHAPVVSFQAVATVLPPVQIAPAEFVFAGPPLTHAERRVAVIHLNRGSGLQLSALSCNAPGVTIASDPAAGGRSVTLTLTFPAGFKMPPRTRFDLRGRTNQSAAPAFDIPLVGFGGLE